MIERLYKQELAHLRQLAAEFAAAHPALAPMLGGASADPDLERLFEGVAFQTALMRQKINDDFPEFIHELVRLVCPQYLRPIPATTIVAFSPKPALTQTETIPAGVELASVPVEGTRCLFRTCTSVEISPLNLLNATFVQPPGEAPAIILSLALDGLSLANWSPRSLRLFLGGDYAEAADLYLLLRRHLRRVVLTPEETGRPAALPAACLSAAGFSEEEAVIPYPPQAYSGFRHIQEFFTLPHRFLFLDLVGWERWADRGSGSKFSIGLELAPFRLPAPQVKRESFVLFATPAVNLFPHAAKPIQIDHVSECYMVRPDGLPPDHAKVFTIDHVTGFLPETGRERAYLPFETFRKASSSEPVYHTTIVTSPLHGGIDHLFSPVYPNNEKMPETETISLRLTCTNDTLPDALRLGDLCEVTGSSPSCATFSNIVPVTPAVMPPLGNGLLWNLVSHQSLNRAALAGAENLRELLGLYLFEGSNRDAAAVAANRKRIDAIEEMSAVPIDRLFRGVPIRGTDFNVRIRGDHFPGPGDMFLFGCVLDEFLAGYASINTFTRLTMHEVIKGETIQWQARLGQQTYL